MTSMTPMMDVRREVRAFLSGPVAPGALTAYVARVPQRFAGWTAQLEDDWPVPGDCVLRLASPMGPLQEYWLHPEDGLLRLMAADPPDGPARARPVGVAAPDGPLGALLPCLEVMGIAGEDWIDEPQLLTACLLALEDAGAPEDRQRAQGLCRQVTRAYVQAGHGVVVGCYAVDALIAVVAALAAGGAA